MYKLHWMLWCHKVRICKCLFSHTSKYNFFINYNYLNENVALTRTPLAGVPIAPHNPHRFAGNRLIVKLLNGSLSYIIFKNSRLGYKKFNYVYSYYLSHLWAQQTKIVVFIHTWRKQMPNVQWLAINKINPWNKNS